MHDPIDLPNLFTSELQEVAARVICAIRDEGPGFAARIISDLPLEKRILLPLLLASLVPDDQPMGKPQPKDPTPVPQDSAGSLEDQVRRMIAAKLALEAVPARTTDRHLEPITPQQASRNRAILVRALAEHDRDHANGRTDGLAAA